MTSSIAGRMFLEALVDGHEGKLINLRALPVDRDGHSTIEKFHLAGNIKVAESPNHLLPLRLKADVAQLSGLLALASADADKRPS